MLNPPTQYATDVNLAARQRFWSVSKREPPFDLFDWVLDVAGIGAGGERERDVLDVGCGNGSYEEVLTRRGHKGAAVAVDLSFGMLEHVQGAGRVQADAQALPFDAGRFDVVLAPHMLYHVPDVAAAARECRRMLRAGGVFVAVTNGEHNIAGYLELVQRAVGGGWRMRRPAEGQFSLENGGDQLAAAFESVERVDCPPSDVVVTDLDALADYISSVGDHYGSEVGCSWDEVVARARAIASASIDSDGALRWTTSMGAFVCR